MLVYPEDFVECRSVFLIAIDFYSKGDILYSTKSCMGQKILNIIAFSLSRDNSPDKYTLSGT